MRIALLSNVTVEVLAGMLKKEHALWLPPGFGGWMETALGIPEDLKTFDPEAIFILLDFHFSPPPPNFSTSLSTAKTELEAAFPKATVSIPDLEDLALELEEKVGGESKWTKDDNSTVHLHLPPPPQSPFYDSRMWKIGSMPWSMKGLRAIKDEINRLCVMMKGCAKKVLAVDFDNTLWSGVIGEDGVAGIQPCATMQQAIKTLQKRGVLLVALTKNNEADVAPVWDDPRMILKREDFVDFRINWDDKAVNLTASAKTLNLGSDAYVFLDDNPAEREQMKALHPEVTVPDWPVNMRRITRLYFPALRITEEDRAKTEQYQAETQRQALAATLSVEDYLKSLEIRTEIHPIVESEIPRVAQLSQKTNQFNVCTNRYTIDDIARFAADPAHLLVTLHARDKFGDQGLVAFVHAKKIEDIHCPPPPSSSTYEILDWVMSCRVMNRRIEFTVEQWMEDALKKRGCTKLIATWRKTLKNVPVKELFEKFGFTVIESSEMEKKYERVLA